MKQNEAEDFFNYPESYKKSLLVFRIRRERKLKDRGTVRFKAAGGEDSRDFKPIRQYQLDLENAVMVLKN